MYKGSFFFFIFTQEGLCFHSLLLFYKKVALSPLLHKEICPQNFLKEIDIYSFYRNFFPFCIGSFKSFTLFFLRKSCFSPILEGELYHPSFFFFFLLRKCCFCSFHCSLVNKFYLMPFINLQLLVSYDESTSILLELWCIAIIQSFLYHLLEFCLNFSKKQRSKIPCRLLFIENVFKVNNF